VHKAGISHGLASEAFHVVGWSLVEIREHLDIELEPVEADPLPLPAGMRPWEPWSADLAASFFLSTLKDLSSRNERITAS
jgi:5'-nucleotidase